MLNSNTVYLAHRAPSTYVHEYSEMRAYADDTPNKMSTNFLTNTYVRSDASSKALHFYFERDLVVSTSDAYYFQFNGSRTDMDLLLAGSASASFDAFTLFDDTRQHDYAKIFKLNVVTGYMETTGTSSCSGYNPALPAYETVKTIVDSTPAAAASSKSDASVTTPFWMAMYLLGTVMLAVVMGAFSM